MTGDELVVAFAQRLRQAGLDVPTGSVVTFARAVDAVGMSTRSGVYWAGHATLLRRAEDLAVYDEAFASFWGEGETAPSSAPPEVHEITVQLDAPLPDSAPPSPDSGPTLTVRYSAAEVLRDKDFALYSGDELHEARRLMADLRFAGALRRSRRMRPTRARRGHPDLRRTVRRALRTGGEPLSRAFSAPSQRPRRIVVLFDVSGSMDPYGRALLRFVHAAVAGRVRVEAFALGTRLTRLTRELMTRDPDAALVNAARAVSDWSGGTRLGEGLRAFNDRWGARGMARGATVVVLSDGWDRGDPAVLAEQMARLQRVAHRIVWVNPLKASPGYAPLAQGMAAALPYVDDFVAGHSVAALEHLVEVLGK